MREMIFLNEKIKALTEKAVKDLFPESKIEVKIEYPAEISHGDYSTPVALGIAKELGKNPREVAQAIVGALEPPDWISKAEIAGAGFINFFLAPKYLSQVPNEILNTENFGIVLPANGKTIVTDTSHPNVAKPMGVHHLLSTIIGNALNRIFAAAGYRVIRDNYIGDWGTQFGKLIYAYKTWGDKKVVEVAPISELLKLYVRFHEEAEKMPELEDRGREEFKKLEEGDRENHKLWKWVVDLSLAEFRKIYDRLDIGFDVINGESFYEDKMQAVIDEGVRKRIFVEGEKGALIAPFLHDKYPPCLIKKSDGATLYATRDLARIKYWEDTWKPDMMINVVDSAQAMHFKQIFEVAQMLDLTAAPNIHIAFGRMSFPEKRMSTRKGNIVLLEDLLDEAEDRAYKIVDEKNPELKEKTKREIARIVGIGSIKYAILSQNRLTDITFVWEKILNLEGNSAPYLQYVYARAKSILRKVGNKGKASSTCDPSVVFEFKENAEEELVRILPKFPEIVLLAAREFKPNIIANYIYELASGFNTFYAQISVSETKDECAREARLSLTNAVATVIKNGLSLLGIEVAEEM